MNHMLIHNMSRFVVLLGVTAAISSAANADEASKLEDELIAVLQSDASPADKAITCKKLAIHGSYQSA